MGTQQQRQRARGPPRRAPRGLPPSLESGTAALPRHRTPVLLLHDTGLSPGGTTLEDRLRESQPYREAPSPPRPGNEGEALSTATRGPLGSIEALASAEALSKEASGVALGNQPLCLAYHRLRLLQGDLLLDEGLREQALVGGAARRTVFVDLGSLAAEPLQPPARLPLTRGARRRAGGSGPRGPGPPSPRSTPRAPWPRTSPGTRGPRPRARWPGRWPGPRRRQ